MAASVNRRNFLFSTSMPAAAVLVGAIPQGHSKPADPIGTFDPFIQQDHLPGPVIIDSLDLHERDGNWFIRARSKDGAEGWSVGHPGKMELSQRIFTRVIAPYMRGKDARALDQLVDGVFLSGSNYKMQGQLFWVPLAAAEFAILDLLGKVANCSAADLLGGQRRQKVDLYIANNHRSKDPRESLRRIIKSVASIDARILVRVERQQQK